MKNKNVGTFEIESGKVMVSDPCYSRNTHCHGTLENVKNGMWNAFVTISDEGEWGKRIAELRVNHIDHLDRTDTWEGVPFEVGVDSGQAGVFDDKYYKDDNVVKNTERITPEESICLDEPWYSICCDRTLSKHSAGVIPFGAVSSSGFGDGGYKAFIQKDSEEKIVAIKIIFISDENESEEDEFTEEDSDE